MSSSTKMLLAVGLGVVGAMTLVAWAVDDKEEKISLDQLPPAVKATILAQAKGGVIGQIEREREDDEVIYEADWTVDGRKHEVQVSAAGALIELGEIVSSKDVPAAVKAVAAKRFPANAHVEYERKTIVLYELEAEINGRKIELTVAPTGYVYEDDGDDDEEEEDDD